MAKRSRRRRGGPVVPGPREAARNNGGQQQQGADSARALLSVLQAVPPADAGDRNRGGNAVRAARAAALHNELRLANNDDPLRPLLRAAVRPPTDFLLDMQVRGGAGRIRSAGVAASNARARPSTAINENHRQATTDVTAAPKAKPPPQPRAKKVQKANGSSSSRPLDRVDTAALSRHLKCLLPPDRLRALSSEGDADCASVADAPGRLKTRPYSTRPDDGMLITHGEADVGGLGGRGLRALGFALRNYGRPEKKGGKERSELADLKITNSGSDDDDDEEESRRAGLWVCVGLEHNSSIKRLTLRGLRMGRTELAVLGRFVSGNPSLRILALRDCLDGDGNSYPTAARRRRKEEAIAHLWPVIRSSPSAALEYLDLSSNGLRGSDLAGLHGALRGSSVRFLDLSSNRLGNNNNSNGGGGISCLARILTRDDTRLQDLKAGDNGIDLAGALALLESLRNNATFRGLDLGDNPFGTKDGWRAVLGRLSDIVCDTSSPHATISSNHTLRSLAGTIRGDRPGEAPPAVSRGLGDAALYVGALGREDGMFLHEMMAQQSLVAKGHRPDRRKALVCHCRGVYNLGEEGRIPLGCVPRVLAFVANGRDLKGPPAQWCTLDVPSLGAVHAILRARAEVCGRADGIGFVGGTFRWGAVADELRDSRDLIRRLEGENERLRRELAEKGRAV